MFECLVVLDVGFLRRLDFENPRFMGFDICIY